MTNKHTPGPWYAERDNDSRGYPTWRIDSSTISLIAALTYHNEAEREAGEANARLIAEAPAMLEALRDAVTEDGALALRSHEYALRRLEAINAAARAILARIDGGAA